MPGFDGTGPRGMGPMTGGGSRILRSTRSKADSPSLRISSRRRIRIRL